MGMRSLDPLNMFFKDWIQLPPRGWICLQINSQAAFLDWRRQASAFGTQGFKCYTCKCRKLKQNRMSQVRTPNWSFITFIVHFDGVTISTNLEMPKAFELDLGIMVSLYLRKFYQLFQISQYCQWMITCSTYHLCLKFAHVGNIVFQFRNVSHNHIGGYFNISNQFQGFFLTTLDLSFNNISGDISTLILCREEVNSSVNGLCFLQIL
jgi:hypothetical protein